MTFVKNLSVNKLQCVTWNLLPQSAAASRTLNSLRKGHGCIDQISWQLFQRCHYMSVWTENVIDWMTKLSSGHSAYLQKKSPWQSIHFFIFVFHRKNWIQSGTGAMYRVCLQSCSLESMNVCSTFHENLFNIYCDIYVPGQSDKWTGWRTDWQTEIRPSSHTRTVPKKGQNLRGGN